jgi:diaminohydroxyphosphoribosylaminopyrimidine deaminase/5-amino-6-(5-phosphoribosylamino)uracil reductase
MISPGNGADNENRWMQRALALAEQGVGLASPNPTVGCVLVNAANESVGEGFHLYALRDHAEVVALRAAGGQARGATAYVTLEPCTHHGRTGPCADALIAAGVARVVIATLDANPVVRGGGVARLRAAGIAVEVGVLQEQAQRINDAFAKYIRTRLPYVTLKAALSLDGRIAPAARERGARSPFWLTGEEAREEVHRMRHAHDAILTGVGTVLADDPLLTDRSGLPRRLPLMRVVLDTHLRTPFDSKLVESAADGDLVMFTSTQDESRIAGVTARGIRIERIASGPSGMSPEAVLTRLGEIGVSSVLMEAGTKMNTAVISEGLVDRLVLFYAPRLLGEDGLPFLASAHALLPLPRPEVRTFGDDVCLTTTLKRYWSE